MDFDAIAYINTPRFAHSDYGLERTRAMLDIMGNPEDKFKSIHVAGTNGKGSTCAFIASVLQACGYKTGLFTSPYINEFEERIRVDGQNIPLDVLTEITLKAKHAAEIVEATLGTHPTEFELMTVIGFEYFARMNCDFAVIEVGLGGRLDSTNVLSFPECCAICRLGLDHMDLLGDTIEQIATEKSGIIKQNVPVVSYPQEVSAMRIIEKIAS